MTFLKILKISINIKNFELIQNKIAVSLIEQNFILLNPKYKNLFSQYNIIKTEKIIPPRKNKITVLSSPHIDKKAREQFELNSYITILTFKIIEKKILNNNKFFFNFILLILNNFFLFLFKSNTKLGLFKIKHEFCLNKIKFNIKLYPKLRF